MPATKSSQHPGCDLLFVTRTAAVHQAVGSTTALVNLMEVLLRAGLRVQVLVTLAASRSPVVYFRQRIMLPAGVTYSVPGYWRVGEWYVRPFALLAWARTLSRASLRFTKLLPLVGWLEARFGERLSRHAWDLSPATAQEMKLADAAVAAAQPKNVMVNYAFWGTWLERLGEVGVRSETARPRRILMMHDLLAARVRRFLELGEPLDCPAIAEETEWEWLRSADCVVAAQGREADEVREKLGGQVLVQPIVLTTHESSAEVLANTCFFVGSNILPNVTGLEWMLENVWPKVRAAVPDAVLWLAGSLCNAAAARREGCGIELLGYVPTLDWVYRDATVCLAPLVLGTGIKIKVLEALSFGKALVSTGVGAQGLEEWTAGAIDVQDSAEGFAAAIVAVLQSAERRRALEAGALRLAREHFAVDSVAVRAFTQMLVGGE